MICDHQCETIHATPAVRAASRSARLANRHRPPGAAVAAASGQSRPFERPTGAAQKNSEPFSPSSPVSPAGTEGGQNNRRERSDPPPETVRRLSPPTAFWGERMTELIAAGAQRPTTRRRSGKQRDSTEAGALLGRRRLWHQRTGGAAPPVPKGRAELTPVGTRWREAAGAKKRHAGKGVKIGRKWPKEAITPVRPTKAPFGTPRPRKPGLWGRAGLCRVDHDLPALEQPGDMVVDQQGDLRFAKRLHRLAVQAFTRVLTGLGDGFGFELGQLLGRA